MRMLKAIERATRQPIEPIALPTRGEVAERRVVQFKQQIMDVLAEENLDFFFEVVRRMESEENLATRQIAAALAFLAQRDRPLRPDGVEEAPAPAAPPAPSFDKEERSPRGERFERPERPERKERSERPAPRDFGNAPLLRYRIEVGKNQGALPKEIVGAIANEGGIDGKLIGQINLFDDYSTVELPELPADILDILNAHARAPGAAENPSRHTGRGRQAALHPRAPPRQRRVCEAAAFPRRQETAARSEKQAGRRRQAEETLSLTAPASSGRS